MSKEPFSTKRRRNSEHLALGFYTNFAFAPGKVPKDTKVSKDTDAPREPVTEASHPFPQH